MNNNEFTTKNDFLYFQNEILGDIKNIQVKTAEKFTQISNYLETQKEKGMGKNSETARRKRRNIAGGKNEKERQKEKPRTLGAFMRKMGLEPTRLQ